MKIRKALSSDASRIAALASSLGLDYPGMGADPAWVAEDAGRLAGSVNLMIHPDSRELVALGVDPSLRGRGLGNGLIRALLDDTAGDIFLATVIPEFFVRCGFIRIETAPAGMAKDPAWCEGCDRGKCAIMVHKRR